MEHFARQQLPDTVSQGSTQSLTAKIAFLDLQHGLPASLCFRSPPAYHVDTDKGFNYSTADESFVCQKKNHFQVTVHIGVDAEPQYIKMASGPQEIDFFQIKVFGVKVCIDLLSVREGKIIMQTLNISFKSKEVYMHNNTL